MLNMSAWVGWLCNIRNGLFDSNFVVNGQHTGIATEEAGANGSVYLVPGRIVQSSAGHFGS